GAPTGVGAASVLPGDSEPAFDVNGDGLADVWLDSDRLRLGARGAATPTLLPVPPRAGVTVLRPAGDLDGDGYSDLLSAGDGRYGSREVTFARGTAAGIGPVEIQYLGCNTRDLGYPLFADTTGDGRDEVLIRVGGFSAADLRLDATTALMERGPTGFEGFGAALTLPVVAGRTVSSIAPAGDINEDGFADIVLTHGVFTSEISGSDTTDPAVTVVYGGSTALRVAPVSPRLPEVTSNLAIRAVSVGDLNGDGGPDLVLSTRGAVRLYLTAGGALPADGVLVPTGLANVTSVVALGDVSGDGRPDIAVNAFNEQAVLLLGTASGFGAPTRLTPTPPALFYDTYAAAGDFDRDGVADLIAIGRNNTELDLSFHRGTRTGLSPVATWRLPGLRGVPQPMGDLNGDGYNDLMVASTASTHPVLVIGGPTVPTRVAAVPTREYFRSPWDWNRDGRADAFGFEPIAARTQLEIHYGDPTAVISSGVSGLCRFPLQDSWTVAPVGDVDGDGTPDLAASAAYVNFAVRREMTRTEMLRVILVDRRSTGPAPISLAGFNGTQALR
ncbi:MAG: VCBS repeat-containing protein, partial [Deltaproteobacteria bacterium]|nr:VCBS repeat-containing protein [Deltaproteobacteria bacterium]